MEEEIIESPYVNCDVEMTEDVFVRHGVELTASGTSADDGKTTWHKVIICFGEKDEEDKYTDKGFSVHLPYEDAKEFANQLNDLLALLKEDEDGVVTFDV